MSASAPLLGADSRLPPPEVVELARHLLAGPECHCRVVAHEPLNESVYRLQFEGLARRASVVVKRLSPSIARATELVAERWLPAVGLRRACPAPRGGFPARPRGEGWD